MTEQTITVYRGEAPILNFTMSPVVDISGWTLAFTVARKKNYATKVLTKTPTILTGASGTFRQSLTATETDLTPDDYWFDVWRIDVGVEEMIAAGPFILTANVRKPTT